MNILITGGASGLGEAITRNLAKDPGNIIYFTYSQSKQKAGQIGSEYKNTVAVKCDFRNADDLSALLANIKGYDPDVLINNAYGGEFLKAHFHKIASDDFLDDFKHNVMPVIGITQAAIECMRKKKQGRIITVLTSALLNVPPIGSSIYIANKAYLEKLTKVWAAENTKFNICSNSVSPSFLRTGLTAGLDERMVAQIIENHPLKKLLTAEEVADCVAFLVHAPSQLNGIDLLLNAATSIR